MEIASRKQRPHGGDEVRTALIAAATRLIARYGVAGVSTRAIADEAGVNQGLISRHFGTKQQLLREVANRVATQMFEEVEETALTLKDMMFREDLGQAENLRALIHIVLSAESPSGGVVDSQLVERFFAWLRRQRPSDDKDPVASLDARLFLVAALILGSELVAPSIQVNLRLDNEAFQRLKRDAWELLDDGFRQGKT